MNSDWLDLDLEYIMFILFKSVSTAALIQRFSNISLGLTMYSMTKCERVPHYASFSTVLKDWPEHSTNKDFGRFSNVIRSWGFQTVYRRLLKITRCLHQTVLLPFMLVLIKEFPIRRFLIQATTIKRYMSFENSQTENSSTVDRCIGKLLVESRKNKNQTIHSDQSKQM